MLTFVTIAIAVATVTAADPPGLVPRRLCNGVGRPVEIAVSDPAAATPLLLVLMDSEGAVLTEPVPVRPGSADLAALVPDIWRIRRACYLQLLAGGESVGSALVLEPMLSRLVPIEQVATNPAGLRYTRIIGWRHELDPAPAEDGSGPPGAAAGGDEAGAGRPGPDVLLVDLEADRRVLSGLRVYPERDVLLHTSKGDLRLAMRPDHAPNTVRNFLELCEAGFYRDVVFHRVVPYTRAGDPFVIQAGDPTGSGSGGPGYWLPIEPSRLPHDFGVISMARDVPPDSAGSQFFICLSREGTARLDGHYCAFGYAVDGAETIRAIAGVDLANVATGRPVDPPLIEGAELVPAPSRRPGEGRSDRPVSKQPAPVETQPARVPR
jgi:peptidyl-prolyl cis-trans isomerase B (cyclophilin B)